MGGSIRFPAALAVLVSLGCGSTSQTREQTERDARIKARERGLSPEQVADRAAAYGVRVVTNLRGWRLQRARQLTAWKDTEREETVARSGNTVLASGYGQHYVAEAYLCPPPTPTPAP